MKVAIGGMPPKVKECLEPPEAGRDKEVMSFATLIFDFWLLKLCEDTFQP